MVWYEGGWLREDRIIRYEENKGYIEVVHASGKWFGAREDSS